MEIKHTMEQFDQKRVRLNKSIYTIIAEIFKVSLLTYFVLLIVEEFNQGIISNYFNLNILLTIIVVSGIGTVVLHSDDETEQRKHHRIKELFTIIVVAIIGAGLIFFKLRDIGIIAYIVSFLSIVLTITISILIVNDKEKI